MVQPKVIMPPWWKDMDFKKKDRVPSEKSGRHSNLIIYLALKNPGRHSVIFHYFQDVVQNKKRPAYRVKNPGGILTLFI